MTFYKSTIVLFFFLTQSIFSQSWQTASEPEKPIKLSIRDKYGAVTYKAEFIVSDIESKKTYKKEITVKADEWGTVFFPTDFDDTGAIYSRKYYEWKYVVDGKKILYGSFHYPNFEFEFAN